MPQSFTYFECDGAYFRRLDGQGIRSIDDVLVGSAWMPYEGPDPLAPALFGNEVADPLAATQVTS